MSRSARGLTLFELGIALALLMAAIAMGVQMLMASAAMRAQMDRRQAAREVLTLALERVRALDAAALPADGSVLDLGLPPAFRKRLPKGICTLRIRREAGAPGVWAVVEVRTSAQGEGHQGEVLLPVRPGREGAP